MNPPQPINIVKAKRTRKTIFVNYTQGEAKHILEERDAPLPSLVKAWDAVVRLIPVICHLPEDFAATNCRVVGFKLGSKGGATTVSLTVRKSLDDASKEWVFTTPERLLSNPTEPGSYTDPLSVELAELVWDLAAETKGYALGQRAQGQIAFETEEESDDGSGAEEPEDGTLIPMPSENKKRRGRKAAIEV